MMRERGLWHDGRVWDKLVPRDVVKEQPLMPLRKGHLALLVAAGFLNNCRLQQDGRPKLVKGQMSKSMVMNEERTNGNTEVFEERMNVSLWVLDLLAGDFTEVGM